MSADKLRAAILAAGWSDVTVRWVEVSADAIGQQWPPLFPMYLQPDGLLSRVMVQVYLGGHLVLESSVDTVRALGVEVVLQCLEPYARLKEPTA